jgi:hypothetical protein
LLRHKSEVDTDESNHDYQIKTVRAVLTGNTVKDNIDFNIPLTDTSIGVTEFQSSDFTIWINFKLLFMCLGEDNRFPCKEESIPGWIHHFGMDLAKTNTKWYEDPACINIAKNQFIFIGYKSVADCFSQVMIKCKSVDVPDTMTDN